MLSKMMLEPGARSELGQALMLGLNFATGMAVFCFLGLWADHKRGHGIWFTLLGMVLGLSYGAYEVWKVVRILNRQADEAMRARAAQPSPPEGETGNAGTPSDSEEP